MVIEFDNIPASIRKPGKYFEHNTRLATRSLPNNKQRMLIVGQRLATGTVAELVPTEVFSDIQAAEYYGYGSTVHLMVMAALLANQYLDLTVCALDDNGAGVAATGTVTIGGPATSSGSLKFYIGNEKIEIGITSGDTATAIAAALDGEIAKHPNLPITSAVNGAVDTQLDITAKNNGTVGNQTGLTSEVTAVGVTVVPVAMAGGATDPDVATALTAVYAEQYDIIATPYNDQTAIVAVRDHLDSVSGPLEQRPGVGIYAMTGTLAAATTLAALINSGRISTPLLRSTRSLPYELAAAYASVIAFEEDPAKPLDTLDLSGIHAPTIDNRLSRSEQDSCLYNGVTPLEVGPGEKVQIVRAISTYILDPQGIEDPALLDITTIRTLDFVRKACRDRIALRFPRQKLSSKTAPMVRSELIDVLKRLEELQIVEEVEANLDGLIVEKNAQDVNRLDAKIPVDVVNGLHVFAGRIDLLL